MQNIIEEGSKIGEGTKIWDFTKVRKTADIGKLCNIGMFCEIGGQIGDYCKIQNNALIPQGVKLLNDVFVGAGTIFENVSIPRAYRPIATSCYRETIVGHGVTIEANCSIGPGIFIGDYAVVGKGTVILENVPPGYMVHGNPATISLKSIKRKYNLEQNGREFLDKKR